MARSPSPILPWVSIPGVSRADLEVVARIQAVSGRVSGYFENDDTTFVTRMEGKDGFARCSAIGHGARERSATKSKDQSGLPPVSKARTSVERSFDETAPFLSEILAKVGQAILRNGPKIAAFVAAMPPRRVYQRRGSLCEANHIRCISSSATSNWLGGSRCASGTRVTVRMDLRSIRNSAENCRAHGAPTWGSTRTRMKPRAAERKR